ncbi:MAG: hypothetical protein LLF94_09735 [Chlamydiales bacterium]|nr:hypothetical protein [Chlamydiales bacterium]
MTNILHTHATRIYENLVKEQPEVANASCRPGAGWIKAKVLKVFSSDDKVATKLLERLNAGTMDAETLRWFSTEQLGLLKDKLSSGVNPQAKDVLVKAIGLAFAKNHSVEKKDILLETYEVLKDAPPPVPLHGSTEEEMVIDEDRAVPPVEEAEDTSSPEIANWAQQNPADRSKMGWVVGSATNIDIPWATSGWDKAFSSYLKNTFPLSKQSHAPIMENVRQLATMLAATTPGKASQAFSKCPAPTQLFALEQLSHMVDADKLDGFINNFADNMNNGSHQDIKNYIQLQSQTNHPYTELYQEVAKKLR